VIEDGLYKYCKRQDDDSLDCQGVIKIENGVLSIVDDPKKILDHMFEQGPADAKVEDIMRSVNRNHYAYFIKDDSSDLVQRYEGNHDPKMIEKENKQTDFSKLSHLKAVLEKEEDLEAIDIPDHIVLRASSPHWDDNE
jgi:hypothetical protein